MSKTVPGHSASINMSCYSYLQALKSFSHTQTQNRDPSDVVQGTISEVADSASLQSSSGVAIWVDFSLTTEQSSPACRSSQIWLECPEEKPSKHSPSPPIGVSGE